MMNNKVNANGVECKGERHEALINAADAMSDAGLEFYNLSCAFLALRECIMRDDECEAYTLPYETREGLRTICNLLFDKGSKMAMDISDKGGKLERAFDLGTYGERRKARGEK